MKKSLIILSSLCMLPLSVFAENSTVISKDKAACEKSKCAAKCDKAATVVKSDCAKAKCNKAALVKSDCAKAACDKSAVVSTECNLRCEKSVAKMFTRHDKDKDDKLSKTEFMALIKTMTTKQPVAKSTKVTSAN